ncbi:MAG: DUF5055 domain-containing protein [Acutalibacteraceae bacterium]|jgi:hypothetical protein|nr:DUF5055 domain-containing protein [Ruminococcus sp.]DAR74058.1 MAG TPA: protein of unknown function (DUF5055) [Caudoviricetes sp.]
MATTINLTYKGTPYTLEFTRRSVKMLEESGFVLADASRKPLSVLSELFAGAFKAHHPFVKKDTVEDILLHVKDKDKLYDKLAEMYCEPMEYLMKDPEDDEGNVDWEASNG